MGISGCGSAYRVGKPAPVESRGEIPARETGTAAPGVEIRAYKPPAQVALVRPAPATRAVQNLIQRAEAQSRSGDYAGAQASLERALRIEPRNPHLWNRLAHLYLLRRSYLQAEQFAAKSNTLIRSDADLAADNASLIARARKARAGSR